MALGKKELRELCDKKGIPWDKRIDTEETLRIKLDKFASDSGEEEGEDVVPGPKEWNLAERAPLVAVLDKRSGKSVMRPSDCFGWLYVQGNDQCKVCPHAARCIGLSEKADLASIGEAVGGVRECTSLKVLFNKDRLGTISDPDMLAFYTAVLAMKRPTVKSVLDEFCKSYEADRPSLISQLVEPMIASGELEAV